MSVLSDLHFHNEEAAYAWVEAHVWPDGPVCAHCGENKRIGKMQGKSTRAGLYKCYACRKPFNVKIGTIFEASHVPMRIWLQAFHLLASSKKGISANQLHRTLKLSLKSAWFVGHRIREAMRAGSFSSPLGGAGGSGVVEADETFIGTKKGVPKQRAYHHKNAVLSLVERNGEVRSFHVDKANAANILPVVRENLAKEAHLMTDEAGHYRKLGDADMAEHDFVKHKASEYVRGDVHVNTVEGYFSIFKRGMKGVYQHCDERHLHRYLAEFDFRYNSRVALGVDDEQRAAKMIKGVSGKRLTYKATDKKVRANGAEAGDTA